MKRRMGAALQMPQCRRPLRNPVDEVAEEPAMPPFTRAPFDLYTSPYRRLRANGTYR